MLLDLLKSLLNVQLVVEQMFQGCPQLHIQAMYFSVTGPAVHRNELNKTKEKFMLFSDHNGSLLRRQPGAQRLATWSCVLKSYICKYIRLLGVDHASCIINCMSEGAPTRPCIYCSSTG